MADTSIFLGADPGGAEHQTLEFKRVNGQFGTQLIRGVLGGLFRGR